MNDTQRKKCHGIIHTASLAAAAAASGLAQLPGTDNAVIAPIQVTMIISLGGVFGKRLNKSAATAALATGAATAGGRAVSQVLLGWIPVFGNALNASTAAGITEVIGWAIASDFANN